MVQIFAQQLSFSIGSMQDLLEGNDAGASAPHSDMNKPPVQVGDVLVGKFYDNYNKFLPITTQFDKWLWRL